MGLLIFSSKYKLLWAPMCIWAPHPRTLSERPSAMSGGSPQLPALSALLPVQRLIDVGIPEWHMFSLQRSGFLRRGSKGGKPKGGRREARQAKRQCAQGSRGRGSLESAPHTPVTLRNSNSFHVTFHTNFPYTMLLQFLSFDLSYK